MLAPFARRLLVSFAAVVAFGLLAACDGESPVVVFTHGVASGDVRPNGAVLWTRTDREATLTVEVATDGAFADVVGRQEARAGRDRDFTAKVEVTGLEPGTAYYYRFRQADIVSEVGTFRTAPGEDEAAPVRFIFSGDSDGTVREDGSRAFDFRVLQAALAEEPDFFLYFGDTIYADSSFGPKAETLDAYRAKYKENRDVEILRRLLAATSIYTVWDDHEVENDFAGATVSPDLLAAGRQAFREYMPVSGDDEPEILYRRFRWGRAVELIILDERSFRDANVADACIAPGTDAPDLLPDLGASGVPDAYHGLRSFVGLSPDTDSDCIAALNDPDRTLLGDEQKEFLRQALEESEAAFTFIVNPVPISEFIAQPYDRWEGYRAERDEILDFIAQREVSNVIFLTTDFHASIISDVWFDVLRVGQPFIPESPVALEAVAGPIGHDTLGDDIAASQGEAAIGAFEELLTTISKVACVEFDAFSYGLVEVDPEAGTATITLKDEFGAELCRKVVRAQ